MAAIKYYMSSVTSSLAIKKKQQKIELTLDGHKIEYETIDVSKDRSKLDEMRALSGDDKAIVPQLFNGETYCGTYEQFLETIEEEGGLYTFLQLEAPAS
eukprot:m.24044 g.24044  ORF g.24044 m.24044 type:complete len:99 (-) comp11468_c1_seq1:203-499(-)